MDNREEGRLPSEAPQRRLCVIVLFVAGFTIGIDLPCAVASSVSTEGTAVPAVSSHTASALVATQRPTQWAQRIQRPGLPNFFKVSEALYRGAQPTAEGMQQLPELEIKTVVNLRAGHSDRKVLAGTKLEYVEIPMLTWLPKEADVVRFLQTVADGKRGPVFVHCQHGADRTGMMVALYRVVVQGWSKDEALKEMTTGGFGYHRMWKKIVKYVKNLDADRFRQKAGIKVPVPQEGKGE